MYHILHTLGRIIGPFAAVVALTLAFATAPALAGSDGGGGEPGPSPATLTLDAYTLTQDKSVIFTGTLTCLEASDVTIDMRVQQGPVAHFVSVHQGAQVHCEPGLAYPVKMAFDPVHPALFRPGMLVVGIELEGWTVPDEQGNSKYFQQFGIIDIEVRF